MPEILLHYIWQKMLFASFPQQTNDGLPVDVISPGVHNTHAGPDFTGARLRIGQQEFCGDVEIHIHASDWNKHNHQKDPSYNHVLLHIVRDSDAQVFTSAGRPVTQCSLQYPDNTDYLSRLVQEAQQMDSALFSISCSQTLLQDPEMMTLGWRKALLQKRLDCKTEAIKRLLEITKNSWEHAFYITLAHHFGFHTNGLPFEQLAARW